VLNSTTLYGLRDWLSNAWDYMAMGAGWALLMQRGLHWLGAAWAPGQRDTRPPHGFHVPTHPGNWGAG
jgi:hypothetical protein